MANIDTNVFSSANRTSLLVSNEIGSLMDCSYTANHGIMGNSKNHPLIDDLDEDLEFKSHSGAIHASTSITGDQKFRNAY